MEDNQNMSQEERMARYNHEQNRKAIDSTRKPVIEGYIAKTGKSPDELSTLNDQALSEDLSRINQAKNQSVAPGDLTQNISQALAGVLQKQLNTSDPLPPSSQQDILDMVRSFQNNPDLAQPVPGKSNPFERILTAGATGDPRYLIGKSKKPLGLDQAIQLTTLSMANDKNRREAFKELRGRPKEEADAYKAIIDVLKTASDLDRSDPRYKANEAALIEANKDLANFSVTATKAFSSIDKIEQAAIELGNFQKGFFDQGIARSKAEIEQFNKTPKYVKYQAFVAQELSNLARSLGGEKGPISDDDVKRILLGLGSMTTPIEQKLEILDGLRSPIADELEVRLINAGVDKNDYFDKFNEIEKDIKKTTKRTGERIKNRVLTKEQANQLGAVEFDNETFEVFDGEGNVIGRLK